MTGERFESLLRQVDLGIPPPTARARLLGRVAARARARRRGRILRWAFATAAAALIVVNVVFENIDQQHLAALTGQPVLTRPMPGAAYAEGLAERQQLLSDVLSQNGGS